MIRNILTASILIAVCSANADAVIRTIEMNPDPAAGGWKADTVPDGVVSFEYDPAALLSSDPPFSDASGLSVFSDHVWNGANGFTADGDDPSVALFTLKSVSYQGTDGANIRFEFENNAEPTEFFRIVIPGLANGVDGGFAGSDIPDGTFLYSTTGTNAWGNAPIGSSTVTIGRAVPEPSAMAFGALALAVTGLGRWIRSR